MPPIERVLTQLPHARRQGERYTARCPVHQGAHRDSLSVTEGRDGRVLLHCFGGCDTQAIVQALGLRWGDLFVDPCPTSRRPARPRSIRLDGDQLKTPARMRITASALYAALFLVALLRDMPPPLLLNERMGPYVGICEDLWRCAAEQGVEGARAVWEVRQPQLRRQAPILVAMMERVQTHGN